MRPTTERQSMQPLGPAHIVPLLAGVGLGIAGFAPMLVVTLLVRAKRMKPTVGKGMAALAVSFVFLMGAFAAVWVMAPQDILVVSSGLLFGFLGMWAALAVKTTSH